MRLSRMLPLAALLLTLLASTANACGWEQTCDTQGWLARELENWLP